MHSLDRPTARLALIAFVLSAAGLAANACSGKTTQESTPSGTAAGATDSGTSTQNHPDCPSTDPVNGPCTKDGLVCEYGDDFNPLCNTLRVCSGTRWASPISRGARPECPTKPPTVAPNPPECPGTRESVPDEQACTTSGNAAGATCSYDGSSCTCGVFCPSYPVRRPDCDPDAGVTENCCDTTKVKWNCFDGPAFCKAPRARVGSACTKEGEKCALSEPGECGEPVLECEKGVWTLPNVGCPISTARAKREIAYVDRDETARLHGELMTTRLATYRYKNVDDGRHLGFIIEDMPDGSAAVLQSRERVDLYGFTSMAVASLQHQQRELDELRTELARLRDENAAIRRSITSR